MKGVDTTSLKPGKSTISLPSPNLKSTLTAIARFHILSGVLAAKSVGDFKTTAIPMNDGDHFDINAGPTGKAIAILINPHRVYSLLIWKNPGSKTLEDFYKRIKDEYKMQLRDVEITKTQRTSDINLLEVAQDNTISLRLEIFAGTDKSSTSSKF